MTITTSPTAEAITAEILASIPPFNDELALRTYSHLSHTPEERARWERDGFHAHILAVTVTALTYAESATQLEELHRAVSDYATGYLTRLNDVLSARSRTASSFITGGANFPTKRNQKALAVEAKREEDLKAFAKRGQNRIRQRLSDLQTPEQKAAAIVKRLTTAIERDLVTIAKIERGEMPGFDAASFKASIVRIVRGLHKQGFLSETNAVLDFIDRRVNELDIAAFTAKHGIWKLYTKVEGGAS
jgi:hypothetical protein